MCPLRIVSRHHLYQVPPNGCIRRAGASEAAPGAVGQAVGGGCRSGGRLLSVANAIDAALALGVRRTVAGHRLGALEGGRGTPPPCQCTPTPLPPPVYRKWVSSVWTGVRRVEPPPATPHVAALYPTHKGTPHASPAKPPPVPPSAKQGTGHCGVRRHDGALRVHSGLHYREPGPARAPVAAVRGGAAVPFAPPLAAAAGPRPGAVHGQRGAPAAPVPAHDLQRVERRVHGGLRCVGVGVRRGGGGGGVLGDEPIFFLRFVLPATCAHVQ